MVDVRDPWMPTSKQRLTMHLESGHGVSAMGADSKAFMQVTHRLEYPTCTWTANRPRVVNRASPERAQRRLARSLEAAMVDAFARGRR